MANPKHLELLGQGTLLWNQWRMDNPDIKVDLEEANLKETNLTYIDLRKANLSEAILSFANLSYADLSEADLRQANLVGANLRGAILTAADLTYADLGDADLNTANLTHAVISEANLKGVDFSHAKLDNLNLCEPALGRNTFCNNDLSNVIGLDSAEHESPSSIGLDTLQNSKGKIPEVFLRGCGLSDWEIENAKLYDPDLSNEEINNIYYRIHDLRVKRAIQVNPLFISYSHSNTDFVDAIEKCFIREGIRFWRDIRDAKAGRLETQIDRAIHLNDVVLLVLSEHSTSSDWVEHEARKAREKERKTGKDALCPIALDDSWKTCRWPERLREQIMEYNILDFSNWQDDADFQKMFGRLLEGLNLFYK